MPRFSSVVLDRNGKIMGFLYKDRFRLYTPYAKIPKTLVDAVITAEDERFFEHKGIDPLGILRAAITDLSHGRVLQGGSTITQQLAKMVFLSPRRTISRKLKEIVIARNLEEKLTKQDIIDLYLNYVYLSNNAYGVRAAAYVLFGRKLKDLDIAQCATLAGLIRGPEYYNIFRHPGRAIIRRNYVLRKMYKKGYIDLYQLNKSLNEPLTTLGKPNIPRTSGYDLDFVKFELKRKKLLQKAFASGYTIRTTFDEDIQEKAQKVLSKFNTYYSSKHKLNDLECAGMAIGKDGSAILVVGGDDYKKTKLNRAFQTLRPIGSTAKPITYLTAFQNGFSPFDYVKNTPIMLAKANNVKLFDYLKLKKIDSNAVWVPENFCKRYSKYVTVEKGLMDSINVATLHLAENFPQSIMMNMKKFKLINDNFDLSYVLGSFPSNIYRIVRAFSAFQNKGLMYNVYCIKTIYDKNGNLIYRSFPTFKMVSDARSVEMLRPILQDVVRKGTARRISYITNYFDVAGKTGTTNNFRDAYFTGFTTSFVMSIWFGRDSYKPMWRNAEGGNVAAPPWARIAMNICRTYGCGKFNPSYDEIVNAYPKPTRLPRNVYTETIGGTLDGSSYLNLLAN